MPKNNPQKKISLPKRLLKVNPRVFVVLKKFPFPPELSRTIREKLWCDREIIVVTFSPELHKAQFKWALNCFLSAFGVWAHLRLVVS